MRDIDAIWERLHDRYGDNLEIVNTVIKNIQTFRFAKNDLDGSMIRLVDELEKGIQDLTEINSKHDIANVISVKLLEEKLPRVFKDRWLLEDRAVPNQTGSMMSRFDKLFEFLKKERKHAERMVLLTPDESPRDQKNRNGHISAGINGAPKPFNSNNTCLIHTNSSHFTRKCKMFLAKTVDERGRLVKDAFGCKLCLSTSHQGEPCPFETLWGQCGIDGCDMCHSRLLHGCTIQGI